MAKQNYSCQKSHGNLTKELSIQFLHWGVYGICVEKDQNNKIVKWDAKNFYINMLCPTLDDCEVKALQYFGMEDAKKIEK